MLDKYNLSEYRVAKEFIKDLPEIFKILEKCMLDLRRYNKYGEIRHMLDGIDYTAEMLIKKEIASKKVLDTKGKV